MTAFRGPGSGHLYVAVAAIAFGLLAAGTSAGWLVPQIRVVAVVAMAVVIALWARSLIRGFDNVDAAALLVVIAVGVSTAASVLPRLSMEAFYSALAFTAIFGLVRRLGEQGRSAVLTALALHAIVLGLVMLAIWAGTWVRWINLTGLLPSLSLRLPSAPFGHPHDVAMLVGLLAPGAVATMPGAQRLGKVGMGLVVATAPAIMFMSGGRTVWLAAVVASVITVVANGYVAPTAGWLRRRWFAVLAAALLAMAALVISGFGSLVVQRVVTTVSVGMRLAIWDGALAAWFDHPVSGAGPGTFPFLLQGTGYFDTAQFEPAHADNLYVQAIAELGLIGVGALVILAALIGRAWRRRPPPAHVLWALTFAAIVGMAGNPAALGYSALLIVVWAGIGTPCVANHPPKPARWITIALAAAAVIGAIPVASTTLAALSFDRARVSAITDRASALPDLDRAIALDPTFPLYRRDRGSLLVVLGRDAEALEEFETVTRLNPWDDTTYRAIAIAAVHHGEPTRALMAAQRATNLQASEPQNQATLAYVADAIGDPTTRDDALLEFVALAPWATADPAWGTAFSGVAPSETIRAAAELARPSKVAPEVDDRWLYAVAGSASSGTGAAYSPSQQAFALLVDCRIQDARELVLASKASEGGAWTYWFARVVVAQLTGEPGGPALGPMIMLSSPVRQEGSPLAAPLVDETDYARRPLGDVGGPVLPSQDEGIRAWVDDPERALTAIRADERCR